MNQEISDTIHVSERYADLTGIGLEYIVKNEQVICKFYNGNIMRENMPVNSNEDTL